MEDPAFDDDLVDPDSGEESKYSWDKEFQRHVAALIISDRQFMLQSLDLIKASYFTDKAHSKAVSVASEFFKKYRILPRKDFLIAEIKSAMKDNKALPYYLGEVNVLFDYFQPGLEARDYLQDKIIYFAKIQSLRKAFTDSMKLIDKEPESESTWDKIYNNMRDAMTTHQNFEIGVDYFKSSKDRYAEKEENTDNKDRFIMGLPGIDNLVSGGGYCRGELISVVAGSGVGKSVMLANITATNCLRGKRGLYISLELGESKIADRLDAIFTEFPVQCLLLNKDQILEKLNSFETIDYGGEIGPLVIKQFPAGQATINTIRAYISQLKFLGFTPDFFIIDYVGEMALHPELKSHESREKIVRELRALCTEENMFGATAMQPNRDAKKEASGERSRIDDQHLADAYGQIRPLDGCISLNQNDNEKKLGIGRGYVIKQRDGESRYQIYLKFDKETLRITEITQQQYIGLMNAHVNHVSEEIKIDEQVEKVIKSGRKFGGDEDDAYTYAANILQEVIDDKDEEDYGSTTT